MEAARVLGLIAGSGELPVVFAKEASKRGYRLQTAAIQGAASPKLEKMSDGTVWVSVGQLGKMLSFFKKKGVHRAVMHGKVQHSNLYQNFKMDLKTLSLFARLKDHSGEGVLKALALELFKNGIRLLDSRFLMEDFLPHAGWICGASKDRSLINNIHFGLRKALALARAGIGQTLIIKKKAVVAVEGMEGTDEAIRRAGKWAGAGTIVVKAASPRQDWRFDVPTIGPSTIRAMAHAEARGLVLCAGKAFLLNRKKTTADAIQNGIFILAVGG